MKKWMVEQMGNTKPLPGKDPYPEEEDETSKIIRE